jgi:peptidoglycan/LPS O-acetylase OafA/YrhL
VVAAAGVPSPRAGVTAEPRPEPTAAEKATPAYRPYLDGMRAVAILAVLVYHLDRDWLPGGYLGVDIFFVLSGYLITMLLLDEHRATGRIDLPAFWSRRVRRLLPALLVLLVAMAVVIGIVGDVLTQGRARSDLLATLFYFANWQFILEGQSYFNQFVAASPVRHTWSLAIEEQFYLAWPIVAAVLLRRFKPRALGAFAAVVAVASALWMFALYDSADPSRAYFGTDSRIFEILSGAVLAIALAGPLRTRLTAIGRFAAPAALLSLAAAFVWLADDQAVYYQGGAAFLCLATTSLIAGLEGGSPVSRLLSIRPLVLVGLVSYGMYLWHYPIVTFVNELAGPTSLPGYALLAVGLTFAATALSYRFVETPIRRRGMLLRMKLSPARLARVVPVASGLVALVIVVSTVGAVENPAWSGSAEATGITVVTPPPATATATATASASAASPGAAAVTTPTPAPTPFGGPGLRVGVVGDSVMASLVGALQLEAGARGWTFMSAAEPACPVGYEQLYQVDGTMLKSCIGVRALHDQLIAMRPDLIIWHDLQSSLARRTTTSRLLQPGTAAWEADLLAEWTLVLGRFRDAGAEVVIVLPPLRSQSPVGCGGVANQVRCLEIQSQDAAIRKATLDFVASLKGETGVHLITIDSLLCPAGNPCPRRVGGLEVRFAGWDQTHFTSDGALWIAPRLIDLAVTAVDTAA